MKLHSAVSSNERCTLGDHDLYSGNCFQLRHEGAWIHTRIELCQDRGWILLIGNTWQPAYLFDLYEARPYT